MSEKFEEPILINPKVFRDNRGYFFESFSKERYKKLGIICEFIQDNESKSSAYVIRGLHYQLPPMTQAKLVRVVCGEVIDFILDIRKSSPNFGKMYYYYLSEYGKSQLYVPGGFAHGFISLTDNTVFTYKCDNYYSKECERGISIKDPKLNIINELNERFNFIGGSLDERKLIFSEKDLNHPLLDDAELFN